MVETFQWSKDPRLGPGSLWAALPIPACRVLTYAGYQKASLVLYALVLHTSDRSPMVFPSRATIAKYSGVGKNSITGAIKTLEKFEFVKVKKIPKGRTYRNEYEVLRACFHWDEFNPLAIKISSFLIMILIFLTFIITFRIRLIHHISINRPANMISLRLSHYLYTSNNIRAIL